jgi:hypothetical protein
VGEWEEEDTTSSKRYKFFVGKDSGISYIQPNTTQYGSSALTVNLKGRCKPGFFEKGWRKSLTGFINLASTNPDDWTDLTYTTRMTSTLEYWKAFSGEKKC